MRLYKMELYKLCHKKSFAAGFIFILLLGLFFFCHDIQYQSCNVGDVEYHGLEAIRVNRQITKEFRGVLTDEKVTRIIEKYGFPQGEPDLYNRLSGNFLNTFIMEYLSDGYNNGSNDYKLATETIPLADSGLGRYYASAGMDIRLEYYEGWSAFLDEFGLLMLGVNMLILYAVSIVFSEEEQSGTKALLFTTKEGPSSDVLAKIAAAFSVSVGIWLLTVSFSLLLYTAVYGTDGLNCIAGLITLWEFAYESPLILQPIGAYLTQILLSSLLAVLELCAITICISARCRSSFHAIAGAGVCYALPFLGFMLFQAGTFLVMYCSGMQPGRPLDSVFFTICRYALYLLRSLIYSSPVYLMVGRDMLIELSRVSEVGEMRHVYIALAIAAALFLLCTFSAWRRYRRINKT